MMNNFNNLGINPMGINPVFGNNIGMNNQLNLMDDNSLRIQIYENRIKELEQIIIKKDYEIAFLKAQLNNNGISIQSNNNAFFMNNMMINLNKDLFVGEREIHVNYENIKIYNCLENDMTYKLFDQIEPNKNWNLLKYTLNGKKIHPFISISENGIEDGSLVKCNRAINLKFMDKDDSTKIKFVIFLDENYPIKKAIKYYLLRAGKEGCYDLFKFMCNGSILNINDQTPIKYLIKYDDAKIYVSNK